jgi:oxygen-independent coproporphyrinogen-3 oxidase
LSAIYIHIPFCKQACHYCDFHFSTNLSYQEEMVKALCKEIVLQANYLEGKALQSIYLGGGTPSLLAEKALGSILETIAGHFSLEERPEITLEANPDDLSQAKLKELKSAGINRLSIGIQSFHEPFLRWTNRAHHAQEAEDCVKLAQDTGFENITIDLMYAFPAENHAIWHSDLQKALALHVPHISAYCLTIEPKTVFGNWQKKGKISPINEEFAAQQFEILVSTLVENGFEHYEISNFAKPLCYSRHNTNYWKKGTYLGIGPSAHSYNGESRQFNIKNNALYIKAIQQGTVPFEKEILSLTDHINEYLMVSLRTMWGCDINFLKEKYGYDITKDEQNLPRLLNYQANELLTIENEKIMLTFKGKLLADEIAVNLFVQ